MIAIGNDHAAVEMKNFVVDFLRQDGYEVEDFGCDKGEKCDYPDKAREVAEAVASGKYEKGILLCGTGIGMSIAANKLPGVRAAAVSDVYGARLTRRHNDSNVLCLGGKIIGGAIVFEWCCFNSLSFSHSF